MARQASVSIENNFTKGLLTEATGLNFPENAATETFDCIFNRTGEVERRKGIQIVDNLGAHAESLDGSAITEFIWNAIGLDGELSFLVVQIGAIINFWAIDITGVNEPRLYPDIVTLNGGARIAGSPAVEAIHCSFAAGNGQLYIAHPSCNPIIVEYDPNTDSFDGGHGYSLKVRDVSGLPNYKKGTHEYMESDHRPSDAEFGWNCYYNLLNRGWGEGRTVTWNRKFWGFCTPLAAWRHAAIEFVPNALALFASHLVNPAAIADLKPGRTDWPSDADQIELMKQPLYPNIDDTGNVVTPIPPPEAWSVLGIEESQPGNTPAPRGKFIFDAFYMHRAGLANDNYSLNVLLSPAEVNFYLTDDAPSPEYTQSRPSQIAFFAGRVWYAGTDNNYAALNIPLPKYNTRIYFSQIVEGNQHYEKCYQRNDPSASEAPSNDLLANDGGIIVIPEIAKVVKLLPYGSNMLVFATNGVWRITGTADGAGFTAVDYSVTKMSDFGAISALSFVMVDGNPLWWNSEGIYSIQSNGVSPPQVVSVTYSTIQSFFDDIPVANRRYVKGAFNRSTKIVQWVYRSTPYTNVKERYQYDRILNLNTVTGAFYPWTISDACLYVGGIIVTQSTGSHLDNIDITDDAVVVTDGGDAITEGGLVLEDLETRFKYLTFNECAVDVGVPPTDASLTYDRNFYGTVGLSTVGATTVMVPAQNGIIKGEDGKIYASVGGDTGTTASNVSLVQYNSDGVASMVYYPLTSYTQDINNELGTAFATFADAYKIAPLPYTPYFYVMAGQQTGGLNGSVVSGLYKINSSGEIVFQNAALRWDGTFWDAFFFDQLGMAQITSTDYESFEPDIADRPLIILINTAVDGMHVARVPSMNYHIAHSGATVGTPAATLWTGYSDGYPGANVGGSVFILPTPTGARLFRYVNYATAQSHQVAGGFQSAAILALAPSHPNGFMMSSPINAVSWSVVDSSFKDINGAALVPFADLLLDRDHTDPGPTGNAQNDWMAPTHQYNASNNTHYLVWNRLYRPVELNQISLGTYRTVLIQTWNPNTATATEIVTRLSGAPFDTVNDFGAGTPYGSYPQLSMAFMDTDTNDIFFYNYYSSLFNPGRQFTLAKFGEFVPGTEGSVGESAVAFSEFTNEDFTDWPDVTIGSGYTSYFTTGYKVRGEAIRKFQSNYLQLYTKNERPSSFNVFGKWDWSISGNTGRWDSKQRVIMDDIDYLYRTRRLKMRGNGKALQFKISSVDTEPFNVIGFSVYETANATV